MYNTKVNYGPRIDFRACSGCGECYENCPMDVFSWDEEKKMPVIDYAGECTICCFCECMCPEVAIDVHIPLHHMLDFGITPVSLSKERKFLSSE